MGGAFALAAITVAFVSPLIGILLDRFPPRRTILPGILVFAIGLAALGRLTSNIFQFYARFFVIGLVANATAQFAYTRTILTWFTSHRGFALALLLTGSGVGSILIPPLTQWMIQHHGWRSAFLLLGGIATLGFPLTAFLVRNRPEAAIIHTEHRADTGVTVASALRTAAFSLGLALTGDAWKTARSAGSRPSSWSTWCCTAMPHAIQDAPRALARPAD
jgi:MFS family permease